jgi:hypothetical protein
MPRGFSASIFSGPADFAVLPFDLFCASALALAKSAGDIPSIDSIFRLLTFMRSPRSDSIRQRPYL